MFAHTRQLKISILVLHKLFFTFIILFNRTEAENSGLDRINLASSQMSSSDNITLNVGLNLNRTLNPKKHVVIVTLEAAPFMMKRYPGGTSNATVEWYGYCIDFFHELIKHLPYNVTYEIRQVLDNKYGTKYKIYNSSSDKNGKQTVIKKWNGLIGDLYEGKADLALAPMAVMAERELVIDFTVPFYDLVGIQILLKKPEVPQEWFKFLTVLDNEVWFSITIAYFVTSFVMFLFDRLSPYSHKNMTRIEKLKQNRKLELDRASKINVQMDENKNNVASISGSIEDRTNNNGNILSRGHQLFIGSLNNPFHATRRRSSVFLKEGFDILFNRRKDSIYPGSDRNVIDTWQARKQSTTFNDYIHGIDFRKSIPGWDGDETDLSDADDGKPDFNLRDSLWFCITSLTPQGGGEAPQNLSGRVVAGAWWLFCFIIIASYTANLAAFLTVSRLDIPIESLDDLAKQYRIKYAPVDGTAEQTYFERMAYIEEIFYNLWKEMSLNDSLSEEERSKFAVWDYPISDKFTKIWAQIQQVGMPPDAKSGIARVKNSNLDDGFALLADANMVKHAVMTDCSFKAVGDEFSRKPIALGLRKGNDQFRDDLSYAILQLINQRFMEILREKWWTNNPDRIICDNLDESEGISIENIGGVFIIILAGVILSFFVWALERFVYRTKISVSQGLIEKL